MHAHKSAGVPRRSRSRDLAFEDGGLKSALGEVEGNACAHHPSTDNNGIVGLRHVSFLLMNSAHYNLWVGMSGAITHDKHYIHKLECVAIIYSNLRI